jgi:hypothetical protein
MCRMRYALVTMRRDRHGQRPFGAIGVPFTLKGHKMQHRPVVYPQVVAAGPAQLTDL